MLITDIIEIPKKLKQSIDVKKPTKAENKIFPVTIATKYACVCTGITVYV